jgi:hypothetical protein
MHEQAAGFTAESVLSMKGDPYHGPQQAQKGHSDRIEPQSLLCWGVALAAAVAAEALGAGPFGPAIGAAAGAACEAARGEL